MASQWKIRVRTPNKTILLGNESGIGPTTSFKCLSDMILEAVDLPQDLKIKIMFGFPLRELRLDDEDQIGKKLSDGESLRVEQINKMPVHEGASSGKAGGGSKKTRGKGKRTLPKPKATGVHTLGGSPSPPGKAKTPLKKGKVKAIGFGSVATLGGGKAKGKGARASQAAAGGQRQKVVELKSEEDVSFKLLEAVQKGGGGGQAGKFLRAAYRKAVEKQYDQTKANARVAAATGKMFRFVDSETTRQLGTGQAKKMKVIFPKGPGHRTNYDEDTEILSKEELLGVLLMIVKDGDSKEMLKPYNMAGCSPRVFWSLCRHFDGDVQKGMRVLLPKEDWNFTNERSKRLSEKALQNLETEAYLRELEEEEKNPSKPSKKRKIDGGAASKANESSDTNEEKATSENKNQSGKEQQALETASSLRQKQAEAALARLEQTMEATKTAKEEEEEEKEDLLEICKEPWATLIWGLRAGKLQIRSLRALAASEAADVRKGLLIRRRPQDPEPPDEDHIFQEWISRAQSLFLDEFMDEILGKDNDVLLQVLEKLNITTPKDINLWSKTPEALLKMLMKVLDDLKADEGNKKVSDDGDDVNLVTPDKIDMARKGLSVNVIDSWKQTSDKLFEEHAWLDSWTSSIS